MNFTDRADVITVAVCLALYISAILISVVAGL